MGRVEATRRLRASEENTSPSFPGTETTQSLAVPQVAPCLCLLTGDDKGSGRYRDPVASTRGYSRALFSKISILVSDEQKQWGRRRGRGRGESKRIKKKRGTRRAPPWLRQGKGLLEHTPSTESRGLSSRKTA